MAFRLPKDARNWFKDIKSGFSLDFDMYYLCLIAGFSENRKTKLKNDETTELVESFPGPYKEKSRILVALFVSHELKILGINLSNREAMYKAISQLLDPLSTSMLTEMGMKEMNRFVYGGFDVLTEWFDDRPRTISAFFPLYKRYLDIAIK